MNECTNTYVWLHIGQKAMQYKIKKVYEESLNQEFTKSDQSAIRIDKRRVYY